MFAREANQRQLFQRQRKQSLQKAKLQIEEGRATTLLLNMLPMSIVLQLAVRYVGVWWLLAASRCAHRRCMVLCFPGRPFTCGRRVFQRLCVVH